MTNYCTRCGTQLETTGTCTSCRSGPINGQDVLAKVVATGRMRTAGFTLGGSGVLLILSAFVPWVSALGVLNANPTGGAIFVLLVLGGAISLLASRVLRDRATRLVRGFLWVLAAIDALAVFGFFMAMKATGQTAGIVQPAIGFYLALIALIGSIVGTVMLKTVKSPSAEMAHQGSRLPQSTMPL
jgi:hypothetical protein